MKLYKKHMVTHTYRQLKKPKEEPRVTGDPPRQKGSRGLKNHRTGEKSARERLAASKLGTWRI